jgi:methionyl-tRNA formyltransferase
MNQYVIAGIHPWNRRIFEDRIAKLPGQWVFFDKRQDLELERLTEIGPQFIFFLHWSWKVATEILDRFTCINFHMTDLPYGRGGSPLQNLILRGHQETKLTAFRMTDDMDEGPIYMKDPLLLNGSAQQIYERASLLACDMIARFVNAPNEPVLQSGEVTLFARRNPAESELGTFGDVDSLYDFIRMLDADGYPRAFVRRGHLRLEFSNALLDGNGLLSANVNVVEES